MRWIVLALSLGATIVSLIHGVLAVFQLAQGGGSVMIGNSPFTWTTDILLLTAAAVSLIGGILAFNRRKAGGLFLIAAALICVFVHPTTRIYGYVLLACGLLAFFIRKPSEYEYEEDGDYEDEYGEDEDGYEEDEREPERERPVFSVKRKERAARMSLDKEEYSLSGESVLNRKSRDPLPGGALRLRESKVCPSCGANVGIEHKFCHTCGKELFGARRAQNVQNEQNALNALKTQTAPEEQAEAVTEEKKNPYEFGLEPEAASEEGEEDIEDDVSAEPEADDVSAAPEETSRHMVFVKPPRDGEDVFKAPITVNPDNSYQEFSNYTRRRKRKRSSAARRVAGLLILLLAVGGAAWMLLSTRTVEDPVPPPETQTLPASADPTPPVEPEPEPTVWELLRIENPTRGIVTGSGVNMRQGHTTSSRVVTKLNAARADSILERWDESSGSYTGPWFRITASGREGWVRGDLFQPLDGRQTTLPSGYTDELLRFFGANRTELTSGQLGQPSRQTPTTMTWDGLTADVRGDGEATKLQVTSPSHVLPNGLAVGITSDTLYRTVGYPSDYRSGQLRYLETTGRGMSVRLQNGRVQNITVGNI